MNHIENFLQAPYLLDMLVDNRKDTEHCKFETTPLLPINVAWKRYGEWLRLSLVSARDLFIYRVTIDAENGDVTLAIGIHLPWSKDQISFTAIVSKEGFAFLVKEIKAFQKKHFPATVNETDAMLLALRIKSDPAEEKVIFSVDYDPQ